MTKKKIPEKLPGTANQRRRARQRLICRQMAEDEWLVWGGSEEHLVKNWQCDCKHATVNKKICCHVIRIMLGENDPAKEST
jgi:hypothetical protein